MTCFVVRWHRPPKQCLNSLILWCSHFNNNNNNSLIKRQFRSSALYKLFWSLKAKTAEIHSELHKLLYNLWLYLWVFKIKSCRRITKKIMTVLSIGKDHTPVNPANQWVLAIGIHICHSLYVFIFKVYDYKFKIRIKQWLFVEGSSIAVAP